MLTTDDFASGKRLAIFTDTDRPCATMLVFVHAPGADAGTWQIEYVRGSRMLHGQLGPVDENDLTPLHAFGLRAEFYRQASLLCLKPELYEQADIPQGQPMATYKDGRPRPWQGRLLVGVHPNLLDPLDALYAGAVSR